MMHQQRKVMFYGGQDCSQLTLAARSSGEDEQNLQQPVHCVTGISLLQENKMTRIISLMLSSVQCFAVLNLSRTNPVKKKFTKFFDYFAAVILIIERHFV